MSVTIAETPEQVAACAPVLLQLRDRYTTESLVQRILDNRAGGYRLAYLEDDGVVAVAGFRVIENLAWGRCFYVDDLVTDARRRRRGHGRELFHWLVEHARSLDCDEFHLDSGVQRREAHRFYFARGLSITSHHFGMSLKGN